MYTLRRRSISTLESASQLFIGVVFGLFLILSHIKLVSAQTPGPITEGSTVSAVVPDVVPPSAPVLISPEDESVLTTKSPTFVWKQSTDNVGVAKYRLYVDNILKVDNIATTSATASNYIVSYNSSNQHYTLTNTNLNLSDGSHKWYIVAYDDAGLNTSSVIWDFTIDSTPPEFVITYVDTINTNISASVPSSIPSVALELKNNEPTLVGVGEANSSVVLVIDYQSLANTTHTFSINSSGVWSIALPILPRGETIYLSFTITDHVDLISTLNNVPVILPALSLLPTATPTASITPTPAPVTELTPSPSIEPSPSPSIPTNIPYTPIDEIGPMIIRRLEQLEFFSSEQASQLSQPLTAQQTFSTRSVLTLIPLLTILLLQTAALVAQLIQSLSPRAIFEAGTIIEVLRLLGLLPKERPYGIVFETVTQEPASYATVLFIGKTTKGKNIKLRKVTDQHGIYGKPNLPPGSYRATVEFEHHLFPTMIKRADYVPWQNFYRGEEFTVTEDEQPSLFIPVDLNVHVHDPELLTNIVRTTEKKVLNINPFSNKILLLNLVLAFLFPSIINSVIFAIQVSVFAFNVARNKPPSLTGRTITNQDLALENVAIKVINTETRQLETVGQTEDDGSFEFRVNKGTYYILLHLHEYQIKQTTSNVNNIGESIKVTVGVNPVFETIIMTKTSESNLAATKDVSTEDQYRV